MSPPVCDGLPKSAVIRDINFFLRETVLPEMQVVQEMQYGILKHDVVDDTQDDSLLLQHNPFSWSGSQSNYNPSFDDVLDHFVREAAQQQQQADLALFDHQEDNIF